MKLQILVQLAFLPYFVSSERVVRFIFNSQATCSATDNEKIDAIFETPVLRRLLRTSTIVERQLTTLSECKNNCAYQKNCRVAGCIGFDGTKRKLVEQLTCSQELQSKHAALDKLIATNAISDTCKIQIAPGTRQASCYNDVIYGNIDNLKLWNLTSTPTLIAKNVTTEMKLTICKSLVFNFEAKVNTCVDFVHFNMVGPSGSNYVRDHTEDSVPYSLFGDSDQKVMYGKKLYHSGVYTLTMIPDEDESKKKIVKFTVKDC